MDNKRRQTDATSTSAESNNKRLCSSWTLRDLIPPKSTRKTSRSGDVHARPELLPSPTGDNGDTSTQVSTLDWTAVISRCKSHPGEASQSYFVRKNDTHNRDTNNNTNVAQDTILTYKPLHAMLKYNPPLEAVEAVLKAHPIAALDRTFEGTALKIAVESRVSDMAVLRLLLVAELTARKKQMLTDRIVRTNTIAADADTGTTSARDVVSVLPDPSSPGSLFVGHNPIRWIAEGHISRRTAALLLKWYPVGAFQRPRSDNDSFFKEEDQTYHHHDDEDIDMCYDSPLVEIVDDFARDQDVVSNGEDDNNDDEVDYDSEESEEDEDFDEPSILPRRRRTYAEREYLRKERRWEKFLHILYATDKILESLKDDSGSAAAEAGVATADQVDDATASVPNAPLNSLPDNIGNSADNKRSDNDHDSNSPETPQVARFHPVHAWIRVITNPNIGLENCRPYGVWSILRAMGQRIPSEFTARDESDDNRTVFQTLAESPASNCRLCADEIRDLVECLMDADYKSAHLPRKSDGRLIVHVALENGWPCRDLISRKTSATCA